MKKLIFLAVLVILASGFLINQKSSPALPTSVTVMPEPVVLESIKPNITIQELWEKVNAERTTNNLKPLVLNSKLNASAKAKCEDMVAKDYWAHNAPDGTEPWVFFKAQGIDYIKRGENLAYGFFYSSDVIAGWMNSPGHRANILNNIFDRVGYGICESSDFIKTGPQTIVVQHLAD